MSNTLLDRSSPESRREQILAQLSVHDQTSVSELSQALGVSEVTIRKDLDALEAQGLLTRVHGGAVVSGRGRLERYFAAREQEHREEKRRIAQAATALVRSQQSIFLDASTTALQIARLIKNREDLTVVTNGLYTALELSFSPGITVVVIGGMVRRRSGSLVGAISDDLVQRSRVDIGFFGARGITARDGMTETDIAEAALKQRMVHQSTLVVGVIDSSKFGATYFSAFALPHEIDRIITDANAPLDVVNDLRSRNITVDLV
jgi:DeoR/GlpR family transcriptional regulator of sugar metabolism